MMRCPLCFALTHSPLYRRYQRCQLCALAFIPDATALPPIETYHAADGSYYFPNSNNLISRVAGRAFLAGRNAKILFSPVSVRMFAGREGYRVIDLRTSLPFPPLYAHWPFGHRLRAELELRLPITGKIESRLSLGVIAAATAFDDLRALWADMAGLAARMVVVVDSADPQLAAIWQENLGVYGAALVVAHPLAGDFAAQRNRVQALCQTPFILQLDCDETLSAGAKRILPELIDEAQASGFSAIGLPRINEVDGTIAALYPDVQYRLLRKEVRFTRAVHEYPDLAAGQKSRVELGGAILHRLSSERFSTREAFYEKIAKGAGRPEDGALLHEPLDPALPLPG